jgi:anaerobic magnesium-protoporphyrin IX monomethyl ester cyclase
VLLVQPPHYFGEESREPSFFPLGLGYVATSTLKAGHSVDVLDIWAGQFDREEVLKRICRLKYDVVGISAFSTQYDYVKWLVSALKSVHKSGKVVVGGALATHSFEVVLKNTGVDACVVGEGEETFPDLLNNLDDLYAVKGIAFIDDGKVIRMAEREYMKNLDIVGFPAWNLFPVETYLKNCRVYGTSVLALNVITARGCPYRCRFCSKTFRNVRYRSVGNVMEEIIELKKRFQIKGVVFCDELFLGNRNRAYEFCDRLEELRLKWSCQGRANLVDLDLLKQMKKAGCVEVGFGVESGSQQILDSMCKQLSVEQSERAVKASVKAGLITTVQMMYGYPGESLETLNETVKLFERLPYVGMGKMSTTTPLPGSELYDETLRKGLIKNEEEYLLGLGSGYCFSGKAPFVNLTGFSEKQFYEVKAQTEERIWRVQKRKYGIRKLSADLPRVLSNRKNWSASSLLRYARKWL